VQRRHYVLHEAAGAKAAGAKAKVFSNGTRDCHKDGSVLPERLLSNGKGMRLADFVNAESAKAAELTEAEVAAIRLYSTAAFRSINNPLRDQERCGRGEAHPLPVTVTLIRDGLKKLRVVELQGGSAANRTVDLYRGMAGMTLDAAFLTEGGTELAPMSTTASLEVAMKYSASASALLLRIRTESFMVRAPDISFLSAFPEEKEFLYPPLTYLKPEGKPQTLVVDDAAYTVVTVTPIMS
jgi:hypothetical protein